MSTAIEMAGTGCLSADSVTGSYNHVNDLLHLTAKYTGRASCRVLMPNGATGAYSLTPTNIIGFTSSV